MANGICKKLSALLLMLAVLALAACGGRSQPAAAKPLDPEALIAALSALQDSTGQPLLQSPTQPDTAELADVYNIDSALFEEFLILVDQDYNFCMLLRPAQGKSNDVKNMMSTAMTQLAQQLELYEPQQCQRVRDHLETLRGEYLIYAASADNDALLTEIEKALE